MRHEIRNEIEQILPFDIEEAQAKEDVLAWIDSGAELCRLEKPATPPTHLVSYFPLIDGEYILLVDHINAELWLPTGGHVEPDEHPKAAALREAREELSIEGKFLKPAPIFLTVSETVGKTAGHVDVSIWYALHGNRNTTLHFDRTEFRAARWFHKDEIPLDRTDPHMERFVKKLYS